MIEMNGVTAYFKPNTLQLTCNRENTAFKIDKTKIKSDELIPINIDWEKEISGRASDLKFSARTTLNKSQNSIHSEGVRR